MSGKRMKKIRQSMYDDGLDPKKDRVEYRKRKKEAIKHE